MPKPTDPSTHAYMFSDDMKFLQKVVVYHPNKPDTFLILKRADHHNYRPGDWDFPGGNVLYGEDAVESVQREVEEETGQLIPTKSFKPVNVITIPNFEDSIYLLVINYKTTAISTKVTLSDEHTDYKWVTKEEFSALKPVDFLFSIIEEDSQN